MLIKINGKETLDIASLHKLTLRFIFDKSSISTTEERLLEDNISMWSKTPNLHKDTKNELKRIVNALIANENGFFDRSKMLQIKHKVDYRKMYKAGLPFVELEGRTSFSKK